MEANLIAQIDQFAVSHPDKSAYDYLGTENTYGDLKKYSDALADYILKMDLPAKAPIVVFGGQTFEMIAAFLGVVKSGHSYVPVDVNSSLSRLESINEIGKPALYIQVEDLPADMPAVKSITKAELNDIYTHGEFSDETNSTSFVDGDDTFYIIFTSGTTGKPKGVQISHDNLKSYVNWMHSDDFGIKADGICLSQAPYSFDLSVMDLYPTLTAGGKLAVLPKKTTDNFKELFEVLPKLHINEWVSTPSFMDICLLQPTFDEKHMPELTHFLFCGEELTHSTAANLKKRFPHARIFNTYGPTETTVAVTQVEITDEVLANYKRLPIGTPKADTRIILVDDDVHQVGDHDEGEIVIAGPSVSKGYINNPEKTAKAFLEIEGTPAYRTGDLGQFDENGQLLYKGRMDFQVKVHGFRIELEDVDHHLGQVSLISQATTVPKYDKNHKVSQLIAYIVPEDNDYEDEFKLTQAIKKELQEIMMAYMMPQRFVYVDSLPLTPNGKIDRKSLMKEVNNE